MIAEIFLQNRFRKGFQRGLQLAAAAQQKAWEDWNHRREQAKAESREFTEPHPTLESIRKGIKGKYPEK